MWLTFIALSLVHATVAVMPGTKQVTFALTFQSYVLAGVACTLVDECSTEVYSFHRILASEGSGRPGCRHLQGSRNCIERVCVYQFAHFPCILILFT